MANLWIDAAAPFGYVPLSWNVWLDLGHFSGKDYDNSRCHHGYAIDIDDSSGPGVIVGYGEIVEHNRSDCEKTRVAGYFYERMKDGSEELVDYEWKWGRWDAVSDTCYAPGLSS